MVIPGYFPATRPVSARLCYCRKDCVFLCMTCDAEIHQPQPTTRERVWICEVCEQAPAIVTCKADSAALCFACDRDIHSANSLASRHERLPVNPFYEQPSTAAAAAAVVSSESDLIQSSWLLMPNTTNPEEKFIDFDNPLSDGVVPVQVLPVRPINSGEVINDRKDSYFELDFTNPNGLFPPNLTGVSKQESKNRTEQVSSACLDAGVVPDGNRMYDTWNSTGKAMDREARVHRYREKRKNRRYDKLIRYASRKAYAESRPRIKGRFAKRTDVEQEEEEMMVFGNRSAATAAEAGFFELMESGGYGVVPSILLN